MSNSLSSTISYLCRARACVCVCVFCVPGYVDFQTSRYGVRIPEHEDIFKGLITTKAYFLYRHTLATINPLYLIDSPGSCVCAQNNVLELNTKTTNLECCLVLEVVTGVMGHQTTRSEYKHNADAVASIVRTSTKTEHKTIYNIQRYGEWKLVSRSRMAACFCPALTVVCYLFYLRQNTTKHMLSQDMHML